MGLSLGHIVLVLLIILILFGAGKLPKVMGDLSKGLKAFRDGIKEDGSSEAEESYSSPLPPLSLSQPGVEPDARRSGKTPSASSKKKVVPLKKEKNLTSKKVEKKPSVSAKGSPSKTKKEASSLSSKKKGSTTSQKSSSRA